MVAGGGNLHSYNGYPLTMNDSVGLNDVAGLSRFRRQLLNWYSANHRRLPWRATRNPYRIWVSEIMLQQTRVAAVLEHYRKFLRRFPSIRALANATESDVLAAWSGLGYYRRARMMLRTARVIAKQRHPKLPKTADELRQLPGIGRYTANAIASIAFGEPVAVVDGNVERVLTRLMGKKLAQSEFCTRAQILLDPERPGDFNQAMMELGATICLPAVPLCGKCPVKGYCTWEGATEKENRQPRRLRRSASLALVQRGGALLLSQRSPHESLMPGMWELPRFSGKIAAKPLLTVRHSITTTDWTVRVWERPQATARAASRWIPLGKLSRLPLTGLTRKILHKLEVLA